MGADDETRVAIRTEPDILAARRAAKAVVEALGFSDIQRIEIATAISEITRNVLAYAGEGEMRVAAIHEGHRRGVRVVVSDRGPGIADIPAAMTDGVSTGGGLGLGLPGARRLMDGFEIASRVGEGTTVTMVKWRSR